MDDDFVVVRLKQHEGELVSLVQPGGVDYRTLKANFEAAQKQASSEACLRVLTKIEELLTFPFT